MILEIIECLSGQLHHIISGYPGGLCRIEESYLDVCGIRVIGSISNYHPDISQQTAGVRLHRLNRRLDDSCRDIIGVEEHEAKVGILDLYGHEMRIRVARGYCRCCAVS